MAELFTPQPMYAVPGAALVALLCAGCAPTRATLSAHVEARLSTAIEAAAPESRAQAAFSLGEIGVAWDPLPLSMQLDAEARLCDRLPREHEPMVREEIVAALGRVGRARGRRALLAELAQSGPAQVRAGWALAHLYRRLRDKDLDPSTDVPALDAVLHSNDPGVRAAATDALAEMKRAAARPLLLRQLVDADGLARARAARGLIGLAQPDDVPLLARLLDDLDERAAAAAALALAQLAESGVAPALVTDTLLRVLHAPPLETSERVPGPRAFIAVATALVEASLLTEALLPVWVRLHAILVEMREPRLGCLAALTHDRAAARVGLLSQCGLPERDRLVARLFAETAPARARTAVETLLALPTADPQLRALVASALGRYDSPRSRERIMQGIVDLDAWVRAAAAESATLLKMTEAGPALLAHLAPPASLVVGADDVEPMMSLLAALGALRPAGAAGKLRPLLDATPAAVALAARDALTALGQPGRVHAGTPHGPADGDALDAPLPLVRLTTERGAIEIALRPDHAPRTVRSFIRLVRAGFYDGLTFHRVVPGFVVQGGDPRGDGSGSSGHLVACEPNPLRYVWGTVGMALSGQDTGSSQFFIALAPAPHLEGRYTAFGEVRAGLSVARALQIGDHILSAKLVYPTE